MTNSSGQLRLLAITQGVHDKGQWSDRPIRSRSIIKSTQMDVSAFRDIMNELFLKYMKIFSKYKPYLLNDTDEHQYKVYTQSPPLHKMNLITTRCPQRRIQKFS